MTTLVAVLSLAVALPSASEAPLIPKTALFRPADRSGAQVAPDGASLAFIAPDTNGVPNVWVSTLSGDNAHPVTHDKTRPVFDYQFSADSSQILYEQDSDGDENFHLFSVDLRSSRVRDLTPFQGVRAQNIMTSPARPREVLVGLNLRDPHVFDLYRVDLGTGALVLDTENPGDVLSFTTDRQFAVRAATVFDGKTNETIVRVRDGNEGPFRDLLRWPFEESPMFGQVNGGTVIGGFSADGKSLFVVSTTGSPTARFVRVDTQTGKVLEVVAQDPLADVDADLSSLSFTPRVLMSPADGRPQAVAFDPLEPSWVFLDPGLEKDLAEIQKQHPGQVVIQSRDDRDTVWVVSTVPRDAPGREFLYERSSKKLRPLGAAMSDLDPYPMGVTRAIGIRSRDGLTLPSYLTLPSGGTGRNLPLVVVPHGGPWFRDALGFDAVVQFLANRGYAVIRVNFRGSIGFGMKFLNAGNHQFGLAMEDDLIDGVRWAIQEGIADPKRIAIMGESAGGYATLRGLTEHPDTFACGVDLVGPSDLKLLLSTIPPYWGPVRARWIRRLGDVAADEALNKKLSPLYHADAIRVPLLVGQGVNDPRVSIQNSDLIVKAAREHGAHVTYIVYPDEGHGFDRPENNIDFFGHAEAFLKQCLGGRAEPYEKPAGATGEVR